MLGKKFFSWCVAPLHSVSSHSPKCTFHCSQRTSPGPVFHHFLFALHPAHNEPLTMVPSHRTFPNNSVSTDVPLPDGAWYLLRLLYLALIPWKLTSDPILFCITTCFLSVNIRFLIREIKPHHISLSFYFFLPFFSLKKKASLYSMDKQIVATG